MNITQIITSADPDNLFAVLNESWQQVEYSWSVQCSLSSINKSTISRILITGLGGSAIAADLLRDCLGGMLTLPCIVNRNYQLPSWAGRDTLLIVSSYSGNTEETISAMRQGIAAGCQVVCSTTGGAIGQMARDAGIPVFPLKPGFQPRFSLGLSFFALLNVLQSVGIIPPQDDMVRRIQGSWKARAEEWSRPDSFPQQMAEALLGAVPIIYSAADVTEAAGYRMKCQFNENSKMHAFHNVLPEMNHNEIIGWETFSHASFPAAVIMLEDESYHPQVQKRFTICRRLMQGKGAAVFALSGKGSSLQERLLDLVFLADWITCYAAVLRGKDPGEIEYIHYLKKELA